MCLKFASYFHDFYRNFKSVGLFYYLSHIIFIFLNRIIFVLYIRNRRLDCGKSNEDVWRSLKGQIGQPGKNHTPMWKFPQLLLLSYCKHARRVHTVVWKLPQLWIEGNHRCAIFTLGCESVGVQFETSTEKIAVVANFTPRVWTRLTCLQLLIHYDITNHENFHTVVWFLLAAQFVLVYLVRFSVVFF